MTQIEVAVVEQFLKAFQAGDVEGVFALVHPDIVVNEAEGLPYPGDHVGIAGMQGLVGQIMTLFDMSLESYEVVGSGGSVAVAKLLMKFTNRTSGRTVMMPGVELYRTTDGKVSGIDVFYKDSKAIADLVDG